MEGTSAFALKHIHQRHHTGFSLLFLKHLFIFERERESMSGGGAQREGDTESEAVSRLRAVSTEPHVGLDLTDREIMT